MNKLFHSTRHDIQIARERLAEVLRLTPVVQSQASGGLLFKAENLQLTGSFKVRPAFNQMYGLTAEELARGIVTSSSGNFAQAAACAARHFGASAKIVMMKSSNPLKVARTRDWGGEVVFCDDSFEARLETVSAIQKADGRVAIHPFDHPAAVVGNATAGLEILEQFPEVRNVAVPISGGGLLAGVAWAIKEARPDVRVWGIQPKGSNAAVLSYEAGRRVSIQRAATIADGLQVTCPGEITFEVIQRCVDDVATVDEESIQAAVRQFINVERLVVEPSGAVPLAAVLEGKVPADNTVCLVSGGNIKPDLLRELVAD